MCGAVANRESVEWAHSLASILTALEEHDVLFIDEIHRLNRAVEEILYPAMEDYALDVMIGKGPSARSLRLSLKPFTIVGATTRAGRISSPLRDRFGATYRLDFYEEHELTVEDCRFVRQNFEYPKFDEYTYLSSDLQLAAASPCVRLPAEQKNVLATIPPAEEHVHPLILGHLLEVAQHLGWGVAKLGDGVQVNTLARSRSLGSRSCLTATRVATTPTTTATMTPPMPT